jgi:hypothetical protein
LRTDVTSAARLLTARRCYEAVGLGWVYAVTKYEPVLAAANAVYGVWAKYRLPITNRETMEAILAKRAARGASCRSPAAAEAACATPQAGRAE